MIRGQGERIFAAWRAIGGLQSEPMKAAAAKLAALLRTKLEPGPMRGLLLGNARRFLSDLCLMLRVKASCLDLIDAVNQNRPVRQPLAELVAWIDRWHVVTGYDEWWGWAAGGDLDGALQRLNSPWLADFYRTAGLQYMKTAVGTPMQRIAAGNYRNESGTLRLIRAIKQTLWQTEPP